MADHGVVRRDTLRSPYAAVSQVLDDLSAVNIDYDDVVGVLGNAGVEKFEASWTLVMAQLTDRLQAARDHQPRRTPPGAHPLPQETGTR